MVCNLTPTPAALPETLASLRFAAKVNAVVTDKRAEQHQHQQHQRRR